MPSRVDVVRLEQEKQDLLSLCRDACDVRDDKIALLEKELARLRNDRRRRHIIVVGAAVEQMGPLIGSGNEGQY